MHALVRSRCCVRGVDDCVSLASTRATSAPRPPVERESPRSRAPAPAGGCCDAVAGARCQCRGAYQQSTIKTELTAVPSRSRFAVMPTMLGDGKGWGLLFALSDSLLQRHLSERKNTDAMWHAPIKRARGDPDPEAPSHRRRHHRRHQHHHRRRRRRRRHQLHPSQLIKHHLVHAKFNYNATRVFVCASAWMKYERRRLLDASSALLVCKRILSGMTRIIHRVGFSAGSVGMRWKQTGGWHAHVTFHVPPARARRELFMQNWRWRCRSVFDNFIRFWWRRFELGNSLCVASAFVCDGISDVGWKNWRLSVSECTSIRVKWHALCVDSYWEKRVCDPDGGDYQWRFETAAQYSWPNVWSDSIFFVWCVWYVLNLQLATPKLI